MSSIYIYIYWKTYIILEAAKPKKSQKKPKQSKKKSKVKDEPKEPTPEEEHKKHDAEIKKKLLKNAKKAAPRV